MQDSPHISLRWEPGLIGNDRYQGNHITIIRSITSELDWNFRLQLAPDGKLGRETNEEADTGWNGMVGELIRSVSFLSNDLDNWQNVHKRVIYVTRKVFSQNGRFHVSFLFNDLHNWQKECFSLEAFSIFLSLIKLFHQTADVAVGPLTITRRRANVIDFTQTISEIKLTLLTSKPEDRTTPRIPLDTNIEPLSGFKYGVVRGSETERLLETADDNISRRLWETIRNTYNEVTVENIFEGK